MGTQIFIETSGIYKHYRLGKVTVEVLKGVDLKVDRGSWTALLGASGSGKTTLLNLLGTLERPDAGTILCDGSEYGKLSSSQANAFRNRRIGFIFQAYHMLPELTVLENVYLPALLDRGIHRENRERAGELLHKVGLGHRIKHRPNELSGGEQQRAAIARALMNSPELILADEPTGNLDSRTGREILEIFEAIHEKEPSRTIIMITHDPQVAALADAIAELRDGKIYAEQK